MSQCEFCEMSLPSGKGSGVEVPESQVKFPQNYQTQMWSSNRTPKKKQKKIAKKLRISNKKKKKKKKCPWECP